MTDKEKELFTQALNLITELDKDGTVLEMGLILEMREALAQPEPVVSFTDNGEGLCIQLVYNGAYYWQNLSDFDAAKFFVDAYRGRK